MQFYKPETDMRFFKGRSDPSLLQYLSISVADNSKDQLRIKSALDAADERGLPEWLEVDVKKLTGIFKNRPERDDLPSTINESLVVELYSK